jgi:hypothetical protein
MSAPSGIHFPTASLGTSFPTVSGVKLVRDTITHDVNIHSFLGGVKEGRWREPVQQIRQAFVAGGKKAANSAEGKIARDHDFRTLPRAQRRRNRDA